MAEVDVRGGCCGNVSTPSGIGTTSRFKVILSDIQGQILILTVSYVPIRSIAKVEE